MGCGQSTPVQCPAECHDELNPAPRAKIAGDDKEEALVPADAAKMEIQNGQRIGKISNEELGKKTYDLVVIGGGPVGVAAALTGGMLGRNVLVIDKPKVKPDSKGLDISFGGPTGLFSKALREAAKKVDVKSLRSMGLYENVIWDQVRGSCLNMASMNASHQISSLQDFKGSYLQASASVLNQQDSNGSYQQVQVNREDGTSATIKCEKVLVATGSKPFRPQDIPFDDERIFDSDTVNTLSFLPESVAIYGGGVISIEYAKIFRKLGAKVTLVIRSGAKDSFERIGLDRDLADQLLYFLRNDKVEILEDTSIESFHVPPPGSLLSEKVRLKLKGSNGNVVPPELECDIFLGAIGRRPNVTGFGMEAIGVKLAQRGGHIEVDDHFQSNVPGIYAAGDVIGPPSLASTGVHQAQQAVVSMFDEGQAKHSSNFPVGMWTTPECAYYGLTKQQAEKKGMRVLEGMAKYTDCLRGRVFAPEGFVKLVFKEEDGVIVGVHLIGADACELVHYGMDLVDQSVTIFTLLDTLFTAVTYHELFKAAALDGNAKLDFGAQWQAILAELGVLVGDDIGSFTEEALRKQFDTIDTDGNGHLEASELHAVFSLLGKEVKRGTIANLIRLADEDKNGTIEFPEFAKIFEVVTRANGNNPQLPIASEEPAKLPRSVTKGESDQMLAGQVSDKELAGGFDLVVIGGGPVGVAAALKGANLGRSVLIVDKPKMTPDSQGLDISFGGPTGLFSKALREAGKKTDVKSLRSMGLYENVIWDQVRGSCLNMASMNASHQVESLRDFKVAYLQASATVMAAQKVRIERQDGTSCDVTCEKVLVATGSKPFKPQDIPFDDQRVFDSDTINSLTFLPGRVCISGGGVISIEYAKIFRKLGAQVTLVIRDKAKVGLERIGVDGDVADELVHFMRTDNVEILEDTSITGYQVPPPGSPLSEKVRVSLKSSNEGVPAECECDIFLAAIGRRPNVAGFGIKDLGVKLAERGGHIEVDEHFQSSIPGIYAAGDVIGFPSLASTGVHQAQQAVVSMFDEGHAKNRSNFPVGMWTTPECAYYGLTKQAAEKNGIQVVEGVAKYTDCLRGRVFAPEGMVKLVFKEEDGVIIGVHLIGADACELVHYGMDLVDQKVSIYKVLSSLFTAVTYHELFKAAALDGNSKVNFGAQWQTILKELGVMMMDDIGNYTEEVLRKQFDEIDTDGSGSLEADELHAVFKRLGKDVKHGTIANLIRLADDNGNGTIEFHEFWKIFEVVAKFVAKQNASRD
jgi:pyruvate/2-oxoglutarate dehydrogenase complex dihydrolipoamide dehydrogenase (E3) component